MIKVTRSQKLDIDRQSNRILVEVIKEQRVRTQKNVNTVKEDHRFYQGQLSSLDDILNILTDDKA